MEEKRIIPHNSNAHSLETVIFEFLWISVHIYVELHLDMEGHRLNVIFLRSVFLISYPHLILDEILCYTSS